GLNLAFKLQEKGIFEQYDVEVLGTSIDSIMKGEDRELFRNMMQDINEPISESKIVETLEDALSFSNEVGYPIIVRPAYTLGGSGGGIETGVNSLLEHVTDGISKRQINQSLIARTITD